MLTLFYSGEFWLRLVIPWDVGMEIQKERNSFEHLGTTANARNVSTQTQDSGV